MSAETPSLKVLLTGVTGYVGGRLAPRLLAMGCRLQFESHPLESGRSLLIQTAFFDPKGLSGLLYWYLLYPIHAVIFGGMARRISLLAEAGATS